MIKYFKYLFLLIVLCASFFVFADNIKAEENVDLYLFYSYTCPHCHDERVYLETLKEEYGSQLEIHEFEIIKDKANQELFKEAARIYNANISYVPLTIIGDQLITGYGTDETTGSEIKNLIDLCLTTECSDSFGSYLESVELNKPALEPTSNSIVIPETLNLPVFGEIKTKSVSLPLLTFVIAAVDGFNPCAMWVLLFLISLLLGIENKKRMWLLGGTFIFASGFVYFLFLAAWLNLILFIGLIFILRLIIGLVAMVAGGYNLREYWINRPGCKVTESKSRRKMFDKLKEITQKRSLFLALTGIILIAFAVNLVELICSAGLPAIYTSVLALSDLATWQYYLYLLFYIFIFMLDDMLVFGIAMVTLKSVGLDGKYSRYSHLIGGIIIFVLGLLLIFRPEWLSFS
ncbi:hypothetical protein HOE31_01405 [bacterium]|jgi:hypothetical protein|nr:hypothetical protein [bacterium]MBT4121585.1 hypothetical protein [bacterium]MBT4335135.1 hypothetical protein [bacterium]MBT4495231.1 hypothetical protein [bacterium]MBT4763981.1 hypothetical protein [bacterium]